MVSEEAANMGTTHAFGTDDMGIVAATIKPKSELAQPPKRFSYFYNVVIRALFPKEHAHSFGLAGRTLRRLLRQIGSLLNGADQAALRQRLSTPSTGSIVGIAPGRSARNLCTSMCICCFWEDQNARATGSLDGY